MTLAGSKGSQVTDHLERTALTTYQEEHALLEPLPGELAEAAQADEFLRRKHTHELARSLQSRVSADSTRCEMLPPIVVPFTLKTVPVRAPIY